MILESTRQRRKKHVALPNFASLNLILILSRMVLV